MTDMTFTTDTTSAVRPRSLLRTALMLDAVVTGANGLAYLAAAEPLGDLFGHSPELLRGIGAFLLVFGVLVALVGTRSELVPAAVRAIVGANVLWAAGSVVAAIAGWGSPDAVGTIWTVLQAVVVAAFAELQLIGLRREAR